MCAKAPRKESARPVGVRTKATVAGAWSLRAGVIRNGMREVARLRTNKALLVWRPLRTVGGEPLRGVEQRVRDGV